MNKHDYEIKIGWTIEGIPYIKYYRKGEPIIPTEEERNFLNIGKFIWKNQNTEQKSTGKTGTGIAEDAKK